MDPLEAVVARRWATQVAQVRAISAPGVLMDGRSTVVLYACGGDISVAVKNLRECWGKRGHNVFVPGDGLPDTLFSLLRLRNCQRGEANSSLQLRPLAKIHLQLGHK